MINFLFFQYKETLWSFEPLFYDENQVNDFDYQFHWKIISNYCDSYEPVSVSQTTQDKSNIAVILGENLSGGVCRWF